MWQFVTLVTMLVPLPVWRIPVRRIPSVGWRFWGMAALNFA
jgi:hypothetical protein